MLYTIFVSNVTRGHNFCCHSEAHTQFKYCDQQRSHSNECVQDWKHFDSTTRLSRGISTEKLLPKMEAKHTVGYIIVHKILWLQKSTHFRYLATFLVTFVNHGSNSLLNAHGCIIHKCTPSLFICQHSLSMDYSLVALHMHMYYAYVLRGLLAGTLYIYCWMFLVTWVVQIDNFLHDTRYHQMMV